MLLAVQASILLRKRVPEGGLEAPQEGLRSVGGGEAACLRDVDKRDVDTFHDGKIAHGACSTGLAGCSAVRGAHGRDDGGPIRISEQ